MKVIVGLSGGVDSAVACKILLDQGYEVEGMYMQNFAGDDKNISYLDAKRVAKKLQIKLHKVDFVAEYKKIVMHYFISELKKGRTGNPCVICNKHFKFGSFIQAATLLGGDYIAMGHYARIDPKKHLLLKGVDKNKDQSYFLCMLSKEQLAKTLFPIGEYKKSEIREIAKEIDLPVQAKKDSTDICFIDSRGYDHFVSDAITNKKGDIVTIDRKVIGSHNGLTHYTIGQRKGLGIGGTTDYGTEPWFVIGKDKVNNQLIVGQGFANEFLYSTSCLVKGINFLAEKKDGHLFAKFRYRMPDEEIELHFIDDTTAMVSYKKKLRAITPGQVCAFYQGDYCLGGGFIDEVYYNGVKREY